MNIDLSKVCDLEFEGIDHRDYPDYCNSYISDAWLEIGVEEFNSTHLPTTNKGFKLFRQLAEAELDWLNNQRDFVYEKLMKHLY